MNSSEPLPSCFHRRHLHVNLWLLGDVDYGPIAKMKRTSLYS